MRTGQPHPAAPLAGLIRRSACPTIAVLGTICCSAIALKFFSVPFLWIGLSWGVAGWGVAASMPRALKLPLVLAACVPFTLGLSELMLPPVVQRAQIPYPFHEDSLLGWSLKPSHVSHATADVGGEAIYDATYSTDSAGFRISPPDRGDEVEGCLLFFSDSFVFGEGVNDDQTLPYQVGLQTNGRFRVINLSVPGYGAEQMLAAIERGFLATDPPCAPTHIFYVALPHHIVRAAGKTSYSRSGPRYRLNSNGLPEYLGTKPEHHVDSASLGSQDLLDPQVWLSLVKDQLRKSRIVQAVRQRRPETTENDIDLYFAIVRKAFRLFKRHWPNTELHVIGWDGDARFRKGLRSMPAQVHMIDEILPGYKEDPIKYGINRLDLHPSVLAHRLVASYLGEQILAPARLTGK